ncbi:MAG TPA: methyltransferase domain-containing protein [Pyrinomonadaceae bacterium]|jgi:ubiquinone/menaquinone biosynthesis C-methylase UbiE
MPHKPPVYDRVASYYDRWMRPFERAGLARLRASALAEVPEGARLVEVGAGTGANFSYYPTAARAACAEPSREMIARARERPERPPGVAFVRAYAERLPFADGAFDAGLATLVFCSVSEPARGLAELRRVVRAGGRVVLLEHVRPAGALGYVFDALNFVTVPLLEDHFNRRTTDAARGAGLAVERVENHLLGAVQLIVCRA